ncbi:MAG: molybdopterin/thiamine biosynthesis adenylyltransferase [Phenylobacterium sp.]|jgi:molybdopterin/thiamine biosynthesis adenylyltransferase
MLTDKELSRYSRHLLLKDIGEQGQEKLKQATVLIIGLGGLGCPAALYLGAAGIGQLILADGDKVETSNLQRQIMYKANHVGADKSASAEKSLYGLNSLVTVEAFNHHVDAANIAALVKKADVVVDCTDNFATRHLINQTCYQQSKTLISGAAIRGEGQLMVFDFGHDPNSPCYNCVFPQSAEGPTLNCQNSGVFGPVLGIIGSLQALETIKWIVGKKLTSAAKLKIFDGLSLQWMDLAMTKNSQCMVCQP